MILSCDPCTGMEQWNNVTRPPKHYGRSWSSWRGENFFLRTCRDVRESEITYILKRTRFTVFTYVSPFFWGIGVQVGLNLSMKRRKENSVKVHYQVFFRTLMIWFLNFWSWLSRPLIIRQRPESSTNQTQVTESDHTTTTSSILYTLSPTNLLPTVDYLPCFHHRWRLLCHHKSTIWYSFLPSMWCPVSCP